MNTLQAKRPAAEVLAKVQALKGKKGMIAAIEPESGEWFLGKDVLGALRRGRSKFPQGIFYFVRVGYPSAHTHKGGLKRV
jgi:hypothetical protein